jgi:hypothetical protein
VLTVLFEIGLGRLLLDLPWDRITEDYDLTRGGFLGLARCSWLCRRCWQQGYEGKDPTHRLVIADKTALGYNGRTSLRAGGSVGGWPELPSS